MKVRVNLLLYLRSYRAEPELPYKALQYYLLIKSLGTLWVDQNFYEEHMYQIYCFLWREKVDWQLIWWIFVHWSGKYIYIYILFKLERHWLYIEWTQTFLQPRPGFETKVRDDSTSVKIMKSAGRIVFSCLPLLASLSIILKVSWFAANCLSYFSLSHPSKGMFALVWITYCALLYNFVSGSRFNTDGRSSFLSLSF